MAKSGQIPIRRKFKVEIEITPEEISWLRHHLTFAVVLEVSGTSEMDAGDRILKRIYEKLQVKERGKKQINKPDHKRD